ncbi:hypothetical protein INS49_006141 [Diaporthe citri]|uniref:uncharacterized protein n=1 Tax=Diaporthe citri TaxID=83186 RepID=UPI001C81EEE2|nr:uncharacterized protein INS49_006141 [Diaporthe citri]KAG6364540.1 hypothetical protein INS49_006141 [Diaporthe citri]
MLEDIKRQQEDLTGRDNETSKLNSDSECSVEPSQLFDEEAGQIRRPGYDEQLNEEKSSDDEASLEASDSHHSLGLNQLFDEEADQPRQQGYGEQLNEMEGSDDEAFGGASDPEPSAGLSQLFDEQVEQLAQDGRLNAMEGRDEVEERDANFTPQSPPGLDEPDETEEIVTVNGAGSQEVMSSLRLLHLVLSLSYEYQPLSSPDSTRILILLPAQKAVDDLRCCMDEVRLSDVGDESQGYTALSYVWGAHEASHMIWFGDRLLRIRPNLDSALRNLRRRDRSIRLWVDAVCINQHDLIERNHQVQQMRDIFSAASETIIYLGPQDGGNTGHSAWNFLERHSTWALDENRDIDRNAAARLERHLVYFRGELKDVELDVLSRSWFRRLWVFQEAVVSKSLSIQCGNRRISWDDFCEILLLSPRLHDRYGFSFEDNQKLDIVRDINISRREYLRQHGLERFLPSWQLPKTFGPSQGVMDILAILSRARYLEASDARDKIYGLVGISTGINTADPRFAIDYRLSFSDLYIIFARNHIKATRSYDIFSYVDTATESLFQSSQSSPLLPSWVPNWHYQRCVSYGSNRTILETLPVETPTEKEARKNRVDDGHYVLSTQRRARTMAVQGRIIGRIDRYTMPLRVLGMNEVLFQNARNSTEDESQRFKSIMELWKQILYFDSFGVWSQDRWTVLKSPAGGEISAIVSRPRAAAFASYFQEGRVKNPTSVEHHLYARARQTADWSEGTNKDSYVITDKESIVDGKRLAICDMETEAVRQLALVPSIAHEGDLVIQISGSRVPFIVKDTPGVAWPGEEVDPSVFSVLPVPLKQTTCQIVGECLLNDFEELGEDKMDTMFVIV